MRRIGRQPAEQLGAGAGGQRPIGRAVRLGGGHTRPRPAGTKHSFSSNRFLPGEAITTWLNTPQGVRALSLRGTADAQGSLTLSYTSTGLAKGNYQLVLYGNRSGLTGVASFLVQ